MFLFQKTFGRLLHQKNQPFLATHNIWAHNIAIKRYNDFLLIFNQKFLLAKVNFRKKQSKLIMLFLRAFLGLSLKPVAKKCQIIIISFYL